MTNFSLANKLIKLLSKTNVMKSTLRIERLKKRISQKELAKATRVPEQNIYLIENNLLMPKINTAAKIAGFFNLKADEIFRIY
ncbi:MAG: transcriptional regulator [Bacteroidetes bacterium]|nr:MAG: transcriptional regulator [Bacteroidota bacterium]